MKKENPNDKTTMTVREVAVLIEDLRSQFRVFGEDLTAIKNKLNAVSEQVGRQEESIFVIRTDINIIKRDIAEIKETLKGHESRIARLETLK